MSNLQIPHPKSKGSEAHNNQEYIIPILSDKAFEGLVQHAPCQSNPNPNKLQIHNGKLKPTTLTAHVYAATASRGRGNTIKTSSRL